MSDDLDPRVTAGERKLDRERDAKYTILREIPINPQLRPYQIEAIGAIEAAILDGRQEKIIVSMAPGTGKSMTIVNAIYRLMRAGIRRRVLFLTTRAVLAAQAKYVFDSIEVEPDRHLAEICSIYSQSSGYPINFEAFASERNFILVATMQWLNTQFYKRARASSESEQNTGDSSRLDIPTGVFDLIIIDGHDFPDSKSISQQRIDHFDAIKIWLTDVSGADPPPGFEDYIVAYHYDLGAALRHRYLVDSNAARIRPIPQRERTLSSPGKTFRSGRVFLSYAREDYADASLIAEQLRARGINVRPSMSGAHPGDDFAAQIIAEIESSDIFVTLLSPASIGSLWVQAELDKALDRRGIEVIPAILKPCTIPRRLAERSVIDLTSGVDNLLECLRVDANIDFTTLSPQVFEGLVLDLLGRLNFDINEQDSRSDRGYDFEGTYRDSLDFGDPTDYMIQIKFNRRAYSSVQVLQGLANFVSSRSKRTHGLLVTNSQLTSVAMEVLTELNNSGIELRVIDGLRFKNLLLAHPDLIVKYFPAVEVANDNG